MEVDFDKEIDALLRRARADDVVFGGTAEAHLDADEITAFAENALPDIARLRYTEHFAECRRCRTILSNTALINSELEPTTAFSAANTPNEITDPWYRKLFLFPNLAYAMGGLVVIFGGILAFTVIQNTSDGLSDISRVAESEAPLSGQSPIEAANSTSSTANMASNTANLAASTSENIIGSAANAAANSAPASTNERSAPLVAGQKAAEAEPPIDSVLTDADKNIVIDGADSALGKTMPAPAAAAPMREQKNEKEDIRLSARQVQDLPLETDAVRKRKENKILLEQGNRADSRAMSKMSGPSRDQQSQFPNREQNLTEVAATRVVGGRRFERKDGVWYDSSYQGQRTANVRRGTDDYRKLDDGLRSIADSLSGTIVVVWKNKAYRIQ